MNSEKSIQGVRKRPMPLLVITVIYSIVPLFYGFFFFRSIYLGQMQIFYDLINNLFLMTLGTIAVAWGLWKMNRFGWWAVTIHSSLIFLINIYSLYSIMTTEMFFTQRGHLLIFLGFIFQIITLAVVIYFILIHRRFRILFFNPRLRWWESDPRYNLNIQAEKKVADQKPISITLLDISKQGIMVAGDLHGQAGEISFSCLGQSFSGLKIKPVWHQGSFRGYLFSDLLKPQKKALKSVLKILKKQNALRDGR